MTNFKNQRQQKMKPPEEYAERILKSNVAEAVEMSQGSRQKESTH
jgi:hypothetical protein